MFNLFLPFIFDRGLTKAKDTHMEMAHRVVAQKDALAEWDASIAEWGRNRARHEAMEHEIYVATMRGHVTMATFDLERDKWIIRIKAPMVRV